MVDLKFSHTERGSPMKWKSLSHYENREIFQKLKHPVKSTFNWFTEYTVETIKIQEKLITNLKCGSKKNALKLYIL